MFKNILFDDDSAEVVLDYNKGTHIECPTIQDKRDFKNYLHSEVPYRIENEEAIGRNESSAFIIDGPNTVYLGGKWD